MELQIESTMTSTMNRVTMLISTIFLMISVARGETTNDTFTMPSFKDGWAGLPQEIKNKIMWVLGIAIVILVVIALIYSIFHGSKTIISAHSGDSAGRSAGISNLFFGAVVIFVISIVIVLILSLVG